MPISVHVQVAQRNDRMINSFCSYMSFIRNIFFYTSDTYCIFLHF